MTTSTHIIAVLALLCSSSVLAQNFPSKPLTILNGFPAGGNVDTVSRQIASKLEARLGQPVIVENRAGASGTIAGAAVARAQPDGYTLLFGVAANLAAGLAAMKNPPYDPAKAFTPIIEIARGPYVLLVRAEAPAKTFPEFVAWVKANPGKLNYGSPGLGSVHHLTTGMLLQATGLDMVHVPYRGSPYLGLLGGDVHAMLETMPGPIPFLQSGKLGALAVTGPRRSAALPDVPTLAELGVPGIDANFWWGIVGPVGMPRAIVDRLNSELRLALADPALQSIFQGWQIERTPGTPEAFGAHIAQEYERWKTIIAQSGLPLE